MQLSYNYMNHIIAKMVQTDSRFAAINKPIQEVISFFQTLFFQIIQKWNSSEPIDFFAFNNTAHKEHLQHVVHAIEQEYSTASLNFQFISDFFKDALHLCKNNVSSPLYEHLLMVSLPHERKHKLTYHPRSDKIAVIMDPRYDQLMEAVIRNFMYFMNKEGWNLMIFSHHSHKEQITKDFPTCLFAPIDDKWMIPGQISMTTGSYNKIFTTKSFWESIPSTHIAIFQKDCVMYKMFDESHFLQYDFAGANFHHPMAEAFMSGGINGGFSLRNKHAMIECIESLSWDAIIEYNKRMRATMREFASNLPSTASVSHVLTRSSPEYHLETFHEDVYFVNACEILRKRIPDPVHRDDLAIEALTNWNKDYNPSVFHGWDKNYQDLSMARKILEKSPFFFKYIHNISD